MTDTPNQQEPVTEDGPSPLSTPQEGGAGQNTEERFVTDKAY